MTKKHPDLQNETLFGYPQILIAGADEVGRGCLAGPVVGAAVILPPKIDFEKDEWLKDIHDSKLVRPVVREKLAPLIRSWALASAVGVASVEEIDRLNIFQASQLAVMRAIQKLKVKPQHVLMDGKHLPKQLRIPGTAIVKGDQKCLSIAAASIIAKVWRDQHMLELDEQYPGYGLAKHKGYPTTVHTQALKKQGVTEIHRRSFGTVADLV